MFAAMQLAMPNVDPVLLRLFDARSFDRMFLRAVRRYLRRVGMSRRAFGLAAVGDSKFMSERFGRGRTVRLATADKILVFIGLPPLRPLIEGEVEAFLAVTGLAPWVVGFEAVNNTSFVMGLRQGSSPWLRTVDRLRAWMRSQTDEAERRTILYTVAERLAACPQWPGG